MDWGEDDVATQLWVSASTKGGSQHLEFGALDWIGAKAVAMQLLASTSTQGGSQRQEFGGVDWMDWRRWRAALGPHFHKGWKSEPRVWMSGTPYFAYACALLADGVTSLRTRGVLCHQISYFHFKTGIDQLPD